MIPTFDGSDWPDLEEKSRVEALDDFPIRGEKAALLPIFFRKDGERRSNNRSIDITKREYLVDLDF